MIDEIMKGVSLVTTYKYKGSYEDFPETADLGDVVMVDGKTYAWIGDKWDCMEAIESNKEPEVDTSKDFQPILCKQCGAPLDPRKDRCDFCHTWYHNSRLHHKYNW